MLALAIRGLGVKGLVLAAVFLVLGQPALAQSAAVVVPCATISPRAVRVVPAPFDRYMRLECYSISGQMLTAAPGSAWVQNGVSMALSSMDDRPGPNGQPRLPGTPSWYVSLTPRAISAADDAALRRALAGQVRPEFVDGARIIELDAATSVGQVKQEFLIFPADPAATHGIRLLLECHEFCRDGDEPWIMGVVPDGGH